MGGDTHTAGAAVAPLSEQQPIRNAAPNQTMFAQDRPISGQMALACSLSIAK